MFQFLSSIVGSQFYSNNHVVVDVIFVVLTVLLLRALFGKRKREQAQTSPSFEENLKKYASPQHTADASPDPAPEAEPSITIPQSLDGKQLAYSYMDVKLESVTKSVNIRLADSLSFRSANGRIQVCQDDHPIGLMPDNRIAGMILDWQKSGDPYLSYVVSVSDDRSDVSICLAFYLDKIARFLSRNHNALLVKLSGRPDEDAFPSIGSDCNVELDIDKNKYIVLSNGDIIGALPAAGTKYAKENDIDPEELDVIIASVDFDYDRDREIISVYISN